MILPPRLRLNRLSRVELAINYKPGLETGTEHPPQAFLAAGTGTSEMGHRHPCLFLIVLYAVVDWQN